MDYSHLKDKVRKYNSILKNTKDYRAAWNKDLKQMIIDNLNKIIEETKLKAYVDCKDEIENLEVVVNLNEAF